MPLDPATVEALRQHLAQQAQDRLALSGGWPSRQTDRRGEYRDDPVFTWPDGNIISPERYIRWFHEARKAAGLRRIRLHDLRHTYSTVGLRNATGHVCGTAAGRRRRSSERMGFASRPAHGCWREQGWEQPVCGLPERASTRTGIMCG